MNATPVEPDTDAPAIPWGQGPPVALDLPAAWPGAEVAWPDLAGPIDDYEAALAAAIDRPAGGGPRIDDRARPGTTAAIVVDDPSRRTPVREALPTVLGRLHGAGLRREDVTISVGVGRHHAVDDEAMRRRVGENVAADYRCYSPPVDDLSAYDDLGTTPEGVPVRVFRPVARADLRILIGSVLPHLQAGFGGGYKLIFPGTSHRTTLGALHRQGLGGDAGRLLGGDPAANPMRKAIGSAASLLRGPCVSISHLLGDPGQVLRVECGDPSAVQGALAEEARHRLRAPRREPADLVIAGNDPWPGDPMQSFKVLLNHRAACRKGGALVGFFWTDPAEIDRSFPMPAMRFIASTGAAGGWVARRGLAMADRLAAAAGSPASFMVRWARELVVDRHVLVYAPALRDRIGPRLGPIRIFDAVAPLWEAVADALGGPPASVRVFPRGGLTYCPEP